MKTYLLNNKQLRIETDSGIITNLLRKGWTEIFPPIYDEETEKIEFNYSTNTFDVIDISDDEIKQKHFTESIAAGFRVSPEDFVLGLDQNDRNNFTQMLALVKEALDLNLINDSTPQIISDMYGVKHSVTTLRFRQIMVQYGFYYKNIWDQL